MAESSAETVRLRLVGAVDDDVGGRLTSEIAAIVGDRRAPQVIIDLTKLDAANILARRALVVMQSHLKELQARTAYLCDSPLMRGLALSVGHLAEDDGVKAVMNEEQALAWLSSSDGRFARADRAVSGVKR